MNKISKLDRETKVTIGAAMAVIVVVTTATWRQATWQAEVWRTGTSNSAELDAVRKQLRTNTRQIDLINERMAADDRREASDALRFQALENGKR